jgi:hypothetical protein
MTADETRDLAEKAQAFHEAEFVNAVLSGNPGTVVSHTPSLTSEDIDEQQPVLVALGAVLAEDDGVILTAMLMAMGRWDPVCVRLLKLVAQAYAEREVRELERRGAL